MTDQAESLRQLAMQVAARDDSHERHGIIGVLGARRGVGTTAVAVNLALSLSRLGWPIAVIDADFDEPSVHRVCGLQRTGDWKGLLLGNKTLRELQRPGPAETRILTGADIDATDVATRECAYRRLKEQLPSLAESRLVVVDLGVGDDTTVFAGTIDDVLLVTSTDVDCLMDGYAKIKQMTMKPTRANFWMVTNRIKQSDEADLAEQRLATSCDRFLNLSLRIASLPDDPQAAEAERADRAVLLHAPTTELSKAFEKLAHQYTHVRRSYGRAIPAGV